MAINQPVIQWAKGAVEFSDLVPIEDLREQVRLPRDYAGRDSDLHSLFLSAVAVIETHCDISIRKTEWAGCLEALPDTLPISKSPILTFDSLSVIDGEGTEIEVPQEHYLVTKSGENEAILSRSASLEWPEHAQRLDAIRLAITTGYETLPNDLRQALLSTVAHYSQNRGDCDKATDGLPVAVKDMLSSYQDSGITIV